ncbi:TPA: hypothetical protein N0F65_005740 [Lagenidium giganteum]|uniref:Reverse transcriptase n=1 Tax=Lagenidium giganteum TaxID=4803 RepID=A0AAV2YZ62_9STRA|nr:TPA: hypothetical protein N0F65_005740 [Lagenidium giganteum]
MLARLPPVSALTKLQEPPYEEVLDDVKRGDINDVVLLRSEAELSELKTSSVMDMPVPDEKAIAAFKARFDVRCRSAILKTPSDRYFDLVKRFLRTCMSATLQRDFRQSGVSVMRLI